MSLLRMMIGRGTDGLPPPAPVELAALRLPSSPNAHLAAPPGITAERHETVPPFAVAHAAAWDALLRVAARMERTWPMAVWPERRQGQWVARSRLLNFPDLINGGIVDVPGGAGLFLFSRSLVGHSDLGVNAARVAAWRSALADELARQPATE
jgi:uncharacterized protein (DUF1499 family)